MQTFLFLSQVLNLDLTSPLQGATTNELESELYYVGLPSSPILDYRTGTAPWERPTSSNVHPVLKELRPVFDHNIVTVWDDLGPEVYRHLDSIQVTWTSIDVVSFAEVGKKEQGPPVLWIGVKPQSLSRNDAHTAAVGCKQILESHQITDVEVEFRESIFTRSAGPKLLEPTPSKDATTSIHGPLTYALGLKIAAKDTQNAEGTGALYIRNGGKVYILTARHVVLPQNNKHYEYRNVTNERLRKVIHPGPQIFQNVLKSIEARINDRKSTIGTQNNTKKQAKNKSALKAAEAANKDFT